MSTYTIRHVLALYMSWNLHTLPVTAVLQERYAYCAPRVDCGLPESRTHPPSRISTIPNPVLMISHVEPLDIPYDRNSRNADRCIHCMLLTCCVVRLMPSGLKLSCDVASLQHEDYGLWRMRDVPGQATLTAFQAQPTTRSVAQDHTAFHQPAAVLPQGPGRQAQHLSPAAGPSARILPASATEQPESSAPAASGMLQQPLGAQGRGEATSANASEAKALGGQVEALQSLPGRYTATGQPTVDSVGQKKGDVDPVQPASDMQAQDLRPKSPNQPAESLGSDWNASPDMQSPSPLGSRAPELEGERQQNVDGLPAADAGDLHSLDAESLISRSAYVTYILQ